MRTVGWGVAVVLVVYTSALKVDSSSSVSDMLSSTDGETVVLVPSVTQCNINDKITVNYQRIDNTRDSVEKMDFVGLYVKADATSASPYDVALVGESAQTGKVTITCKKPGDMELRMIRVPGKIIGRVAITVFAPCLEPTCNGHGVCDKGECKCNAGWEGTVCDLLSGDGLSLTWQNINGRSAGEFYPGDTITVNIASSKTKPTGDGTDMVRVFGAANQGFSIQSVYIPAGSTSVDIAAPSQPGAYLVKFLRGQDLQELASSTAFTVYELCPAQCSYHGLCQKGKCVCAGGFDRLDCSRGPGVVTLTISDEAYIGQPLAVVFQRDETSGVLTDSDWLGVYKEHDDSTDNPEYYAFAISTKIYDPDIRATLPNANITNGTVTLYMPYQPGQFVVKYVRADHAKYAVSAPFAVYPLCSQQCNVNGKCRRGKCACKAGWLGEDCAISDAAFEITVVSPAAGHDLTTTDILVVNFTRPTGNNSDYDFVGVYGAGSANNSDLLYYYNYAAAEAKNATVPTERGQLQLALPAPGSMVLRYINAYTLETEVESNVFEVYASCDTNCSDHGVCLKGRCVCEAEWTGDDCSAGKGLVKLAPTKGVPVDMTENKLGFEVHVIRPPGKFHVGDFIALFPASGPFDVNSTWGYSYTRSKDESDVYLIVNAGQSSRLTQGKFVVKYFSASHEVLGSSEEFAFKFE